MTERRATPNILEDLMSATPAGAAKPAADSLRIADIRRDGGTQPRAGLDEAHVADLLAALVAGDTLPPVDVMYDGASYWLYDGYHRVEASSRHGHYTVQAVIHQGDQAAAQWASYAANSKHGLKRTNDDKRRQVIAALRHPTGASLSNREIARHVGVDEGTVRGYREKMESAAEIPQVTERKGADGKVYNTANIGSNRPSQPQRDDAAEDAWTARQEAPAVAYAGIPELEAHVRECAAEFYREETPRYAASDMRAAARVEDGGFWKHCNLNVIAQYRKRDLVHAINNVASQMEAKAGRPLVEVIKTDDELAAAAQAADIASRNAAADEAERQAQAAAAADVAFGIDPASRNAHLVHVLDMAMAALPEIGDIIGQRQYCLSVATTLGLLRKSLLTAVANEASALTAPAPAAPVAGAVTELPADLIAHGWELVQVHGRMYASIKLDGEEKPITTVKRSDVAVVVQDARYLDKQLRIGASA